MAADSSRLVVECCMLLLTTDILHDLMYQNLTNLAIVVVCQRTGDTGEKGLRKDRHPTSGCRTSTIASLDEMLCRLVLHDSALAFCCVIKSVRVRT